MGNTTFWSCTGCCLFERVCGMYGQQWDKQPKENCRVYCSGHVVASSAGSISCAIGYSCLRPAPVQALSLFLVHFPEALMETSAFEQRCCGCPLSLSTSGCPGWVSRETTVSTRQCAAHSVYSHILQFCPDSTTHMAVVLPPPPPMHKIRKRTWVI